MAGIEEVKFSVNGVEFTTQVDEETFVRLCSDVDFASRYVQQILATGCLSAYIPIDSVLEDVAILVGTPNEFRLQSKPTASLTSESAENPVSETSQCPALDPAAIPTSTKLKRAELPEFKCTYLSTKLLIETRYKYDAKFEDKLSRASVLWELVTAEMSSVGGYTLNGPTASSKFNNILKTYRANLDKMKTSGEAALKWEFFGIMQELFGKKSSSEPGPGQLKASFLLDTQTAGSSGCAAQKVTAATRPQGTKRRASTEEPPAWFLEYVKEKKKEDLAREERLVQEQRRIQALEEEKVQLLREYLQAQKKD